MTARRWDTDARGIGIADAEPFAAPIRELLQATSESGWVTEDADAHLGVHLRRACAEPGSPWTWIAATQGSDGVFAIELSHSSDRVMDVWREAVALLSTIAEDSFHVRRVDDQTIEAVTGMLPGDGDFATHGHTIRLLVRSGGSSSWRSTLRGEDAHRARVRAPLRAPAPRSAMAVRAAHPSREEPGHPGT